MLTGFAGRCCALIRQSNQVDTPSPYLYNGLCLCPYEVSEGVRTEVNGCRGIFYYDILGRFAANQRRVLLSPTERQCELFTISAMEAIMLLRTSVGTNNFVKVSLVALFAILAPSAHAQSATVGEPSNPGALAGELQTAYNNGARNITINSGIYTMPALGSTNVPLNKWSNATISAYNVTIINSDNSWNDNNIELNGCNNVTFEGATLSQTAQTAYQGLITNISQDSSGNNLVYWTLDTGYPAPDTTSGITPNIVDGGSRTLKYGVGDYYNLPTDTLGSGNYCTHFGTNNISFGVGDYIVGRGGPGAGFRVHLVNSSNCTVQDVTLLHNGFATIREEGTGGGNHFLHCIWALGPSPDGATNNPLVSCQSDGFHSTDANPGPDIENCVFQGVLLDDCIAIHGYFSNVSSVGSNSVVVTWNQWNVNDPIRLSDIAGGYQDATVTGISQIDSGHWNITLDRSPGVTYQTYNDGKSGTRASNPNLDGQGYKVLNCQIGDTRSRGILAKGDNGDIENNTIVNCGMSAVSVGPEFYWGESDYVHNVTVANNTFRNNGHATYGGATVWIHGDGAMGNSNISVHDNLFDTNYIGDIDAQYVNGCTIENNRFLNSNSAAFGPSWSVNLASSNNIQFSGNAINDRGSYGGPLVNVGGGVTNVTNQVSGMSVSGQVPYSNSEPYFMIVNKYTNMPLQVSGGTTTNGASITQWTYDNGSANQRWALQPSENSDHFKLVSWVDGRCACIASNSTSTGAQLLEWDYSANSTAQQFDLVNAGNGYFKIRNVNSGLILDDAGRGTWNNTKVIQWTDNNADNQMWYLQPWGTYNIRSAGGRYLCVAGQGSSNGDQIILWDYYNDPWFKWNFTNEGAGYFGVFSVNAPGRVLCVDNGSYSASANTQLWDYDPNNSGDQLVSILPLTNGNFKFYFKHDGMSWDIPGGNTADGAPLVQYSDDANWWQQFSLERTN